jgi:hypothetical protein
MQACHSERDKESRFSAFAIPCRRTPRSLAGSGRHFATGYNICETGLDFFQDRGEESIAWMHPRQRAQVRSTRERRRVIPV